MQLSTTLPLPLPRAPIPNLSPPPESKDVYIPAGSVGNPLGIRPSSNPTMTMTPNQRPLPSGPRSLRTATTVTTAKKPVVVGANWSAARSSASTSTNNSVPITSSSSSSSLISSASASTNSTLRPTSKATDLSRILSYGSPSPPPPSDSKPPLPPSQCQSGPSKWKRITGDEKASASSSSSDNSKTVNPPPASSTQTGQVDATSSTKHPPKQTVPLSSPKPNDLKIIVQANASSTDSLEKSPAKRPTPSPSDSSDDRKQGDVDIESPSKKAKTTESATSSASKNSAPAKAQLEALKAPTSKREWFGQQRICVMTSNFSNSSTTTHTSTTSQASPRTYWILIQTFVKARTKSKSGCRCLIKATNNQYRLACYIL